MNDDETPSDDDGTPSDCFFHLLVLFKDMLSTSILLLSWLDTTTSYGSADTLWDIVEIMEEKQYGIETILRNSQHIIDVAVQGAIDSNWELLYEEFGDDYDQMAMNELDQLPSEYDSLKDKIAVLESEYDKICRDINIVNQYTAVLGRRERVQEIEKARIELENMVMFTEFRTKASGITHSEIPKVTLSEELIALALGNQDNVGKILKYESTLRCALCLCLLL